MNSSRRLPEEAKGMLSDLASIEAAMAQAIMRPLEGDKMQKFSADGREMEAVAAEFIKPNRFLSSSERLELYNRQYWYRLLDALYEDFPGLLAALGQECCEALATAYLRRYPSNSFTLRNLGSRLAQFVMEEPDWVAADQKLALDLIRFEWAEVVAFDGGAKPAITPDSLSGCDPMDLKLGLQPYISLLELDYAVDTFLLKLNKKSEKAVESNAVIQIKRKKKGRLRPSQEHNYVAVHRLDNVVYYKRLESQQYMLLNALSAGKTLAQACAEAFDVESTESNAKAFASPTQDFSDWMELGWFCHAV